MIYHCCSINLLFHLLFLTQLTSTIRLSYPEPALSCYLVSYLLINQQLYLPQSHPTSCYYDERLITKLHLVRNLVVDSLDTPEVVVFCKGVGMSGEGSDVMSIRIERYLLRLSSRLPILNNKLYLMSIILNSCRSYLTEYPLLWFFVLDKPICMRLFCLHKQKITLLVLKAVVIDEGFLGF